MSIYLRQLQPTTGRQRQNCVVTITISDALRMKSSSVRPFLLEFIFFFVLCANTINCFWNNNALFLFTSTDKSKYFLCLRKFIYVALTLDNAIHVEWVKLYAVISWSVVCNRSCVCARCVKSLSVERQFYLRNNNDGQCKCNDKDIAMFSSKTWKLFV